MVECSHSRVLRWGSLRWAYGISVDNPARLTVKLRIKILGGIFLGGGGEADTARSNDADRADTPTKAQFATSFSSSIRQYITISALFTKQSFGLQTARSALNSHVRPLKPALQY